MSVIERAVAGLCRTVLWLSTLVIFVILCANTILRYATGASLQWGNEVPELLFPWLVMAGVVLAALHGAHITTSFLMAKLKPSVQRPLSTFAWLVVTTLYGTLAWATLQMLPIVHDERSPILQVPGSVTYACVMVGMGLLALLAAISAWRAWTTPVAAVQPDTASGNAQIPAAHW